MPVTPNLFEVNDARYILCPLAPRGRRYGVPGDRSARKKAGRNMHIARRFTTAGHDAYEGVAFRSAASEIRNPDGSVVFAAEGIEVPTEWSQVACDILAQKYLRKAGVPKRLKAVEEPGVPEWLWRRIPDAAALASLPEGGRNGAETSAKQRFD